MKILIILSTLLILTGSVIAQCTIRPGTRIGYTPPVYQAEHYPYQSHYQFIPKIIEVETHRDHYYSIDSFAQQNLLADAIVGRLMRLQGQGTSIKLGNQPQGNQETLSKADFKYKSKSAPSPYQNEKLLALMAKSCNRCHQNTSNYPLITSDNRLLDITEGFAWKMFGLVNSGEMPKASPQVDDESVKLFYECAKNVK